MHQALVLHFLEGTDPGRDRRAARHLARHRQPADQARPPARSGRDQDQVADRAIWSTWKQRLVALGGIEPRGGRADGLRQSADRAASVSARRRRGCCSNTINDGDTICITGGKGVSALVAGLQAAASLRCRGHPGHRLRAGQALYRRQSCRVADGRQARRPCLPDPCAAVCR